MGRRSYWPSILPTVLRVELPKCVPCGITYQSYKKKGTVVFGISVQDVKSKRAYADKNQLNFPILADTEKKTAQAYGVLGKSGYADRVTFIVGPDGKVKNIDRAMRFDRGPSGLQSSHASALLLALSEKWKAELNKPIPSFTLKNYDGTSVTSTDTKSKLTVITRPLL